MKLHIMMIIPNILRHKTKQNWKYKDELRKCSCCCCCFCSCDRLREREREAQVKMVIRWRDYLAICCHQSGIVQPTEIRKTVLSSVSLATAISLPEERTHVLLHVLSPLFLSCVIACFFLFLFSFGFVSSVTCSS